MRRILRFTPPIEPKGMMYISSVDAKIDLREESKCTVTYRIKTKKRTEKRLAKINKWIESSDKDDPSLMLVLGGSWEGVDISYKDHVFNVARYMMLPEWNADSENHKNLFLNSRVATGA